MAYKFRCFNCGTEIITKHLRIGETALCRECGSYTVVPKDALQVEGESSIIKHLATQGYTPIEHEENYDDQPVPPFTETLRITWQTIKANPEVSISAGLIFYINSNHRRVSDNVF